MSHGLTTQAIALLFSSAPTLDKLREALASYTPTLRECEDSWPAQSPSLSFSIPDVPETSAIIDIVHQPWPDDLSQDDHSSDIFLAWKLGHFGPVARPVALSRALTRTFLTHNESQAVREHNSFLRLRTMSTDPNALAKGSAIKTPLLACQHLAILDRLAVQLLDLPGALAYFNPAGANVLSRNHFNHFTKQAQDLGLINTLVWTNRFFYTVNDHWSFFETLGNRQFHLPDLELPLSSAHHEHIPACKTFLANLTLQMINNRQFIASDTLVAGPADLNYKAHYFPVSLVEPDRPIILLLPEGMDELPPAFPRRPNS